ncbi:hypothetical protein [Aidingimonas halophila]|uniref:HEPN AbiU2-like domain-containing protein n=1 Tax=Aidingimonas halophila TaxID=574349 RepID=A0A1H2SVW3_9GAMM|nr:hypothetical protein [Aidingimonas halophila]GHC17038.1 hypothetical protein GCM10008094_03030 [Aidingimonas halophila]SDW35742.1 hypothetical protein SAMN05443545_101671 [Aidingimonas halophila]
MTISQQKKKIEHLAEAIVGKYFMADQERALMEPIVSDESIIKHWDNSLAAHGLEALRMSLYMSVLSAMNSLLFDNYAKTASLYNVCKMLEDERLVGLLREAYCKPLEINHLNDDLDEEAKRVIETSINAEHRELASDDFDQRLKAVREGYERLCKSSLAERVQNARDRMVAHYQVTSLEGERRLYNPADFGLKWGDASEIMAQAKVIIFDVPLIVSGRWYCVDDYVLGHKDIAAQFWNRASD